MEWVFTDQGLQVVCLKQCFLHGAYFKIIHTHFSCSFLKVKPFFPENRQVATFFLVKLNAYCLIFMPVRMPSLILSLCKECFLFGSIHLFLMTQYSKWDFFFFFSQNECLSLKVIKDLFRFLCFRRCYTIHEFSIQWPEIFFLMSHPYRNISYLRSIWCNVSVSLCTHVNPKGHNGCPGPSSNLYFQYHSLNQCLIMNIYNLEMMTLNYFY